MLGLENMLSSMLGVSPEEMRNMFVQMVSAATEGMETMKRLEENQQKMMAEIASIRADFERLENAETNSGG